MLFLISFYRFGGKGRFLLATAVAMSVFFPLQGRAEPEPVKTAMDTTSISDAGALASPSPKETPTGHEEHEEVEPLENWYVPGEKQAKTATPTPEPTIATPLTPEEKVKETIGIDISAKSVKFESDAKDYDPLFAASVPQEATLNKAQLRRLDRAKKIRVQVAKRRNKQLKIPTLEDDLRGPPELRLCTANLETYGEIAAFIKTFRESRLGRRSAVESSALAAIKQADCDIVALQGVFGDDDAIAKVGMDQFAEKLSQSTSAKWTAYVGSPFFGVIRNGFLVRGDEIEVIRTRSRDDVKVYRFGEFRLKDYPRLPYELSVRVKKNGGNESKVLVLTSIDVRPTSGKLEPEYGRMQLAEGARQAIDKDREKLKEVLPVYVILGERAGGKHAPATQIIEGRLRLQDFLNETRCKLFEPEPPEGTKKRKRKKNVPQLEVSCNKPADYFKTYFGIISDDLGPADESRRVKVGKKFVIKNFRESKRTKKARLKMASDITAEIYLPQADLPLAYNRPYKEGHFKSGTVPLSNNRRNSPLVWVEFNW